MSPTMEAALALLALWGTFAMGHHYGVKLGVERERARVVGLAQATFSVRWSGSVRWLLNAVCEGSQYLMPEREFFGDQSIEKTTPDEAR